MANKRLNAIITIGGAVSGSLMTALGGTRNKLRAIGEAVRDLEKDQKHLGKTIREAMQQGRPVGELANRYRELEQRIKAARQEQDRMNRAVRGMDAGKDAMRRGAGIFGGAAAAAAVGVLPVVQAAQFEKAMLGVAKQVAGARDESGQLTQVYYDMFRQVQMLGREIPIATSEIALMVAAGARMGVAKDELIGFVRTASMMASAFDLPADQLAEDMGKIAGLYKIPIPAIGQLADAINFLDDNAISKGQDIIDFLTRTGGVAGSVKVTGKEMAALGSTLLTLGERSETASTATNALFQKLAAADKGTKKFKEAMEEIGLSLADVQRGMQTDAQGTILKVLDAVAKLPAEKRLGVLVEMVGLEHSDTIAKLAGNLGEYRKQIDLVNSQKVEGSMSREFAAQLASTNAQWEIAKNRVAELGVNIGTVLLPAINNMLGGIGTVTSAVADFTREHPILTKNIGVLAAAVVGSVAAWGGLTFAIGAVQTAFWGLTAAIAMNPIGALVVGLVAGAALIYANWEPIRDFFVGLFDDIKKTVGEAIDWMLAKINAVGDAWRATKAFFGFGDEKPASVTPARPGAPAAPAVAAAPPPPPAVPPMASKRAGTTLNDNSTHNWNITAQPGQDPKAIAKAAVDELDRRQRQRQGGALFDSARGY